MIEGVAVVGGDERILYCNAAFEQILELPEGSSQGRKLVEALRAGRTGGRGASGIKGGEEVTGEVEVGTVRRRSFSVTAAPVHAAGPSSAVLVLHDITELRRLERVRQDFVANVSHEFKTPLTAIQGFAETLLVGALDDKANRKRFVEIIRDHAGRLARLTDDLLKLSRIEAGRLELELRPVRVEELVNSCVETSRMKAEKKGLQIRVQVPAGLPPVRGDGAQLGEVLQNLLDNAMQYTPARWTSRRDRQLKRTRRYFHRYRHRDWHSRVRIGTNLRALLPCRRGTFTRSGRHRTRPGHRTSYRGRTQWTYLGGKRCWPRLAVSFQRRRFPLTRGSSFTRKGGSVSREIHPCFIPLSQMFDSISLPCSFRGESMASPVGNIQTIYEDVLANYLIFDGPHRREQCRGMPWTHYCAPNMEVAAKLSSQVFLVEPRINEMEMLIDDHGSLRMLRTGLLDDEEIRRVVASQKIANDLERIGDLAVNISERVISL